MNLIPLIVPSWSSHQSLPRVRGQTERTELLKWSIQGTHHLSSLLHPQFEGHSKKDLGYASAMCQACESSDTVNWLQVQGTDSQQSRQQNAASAPPEAVCWTRRKAHTKTHESVGQEMRSHHQGWLTAVDHFSVAGSQGVGTPWRLLRIFYDMFLMS